MGGIFSSGMKDRPSKRYRRTLSQLSPTLRGQTHAITGTTSGTGLAAAIALAKAGVNTILLNRPSSRATAAEAKVRKVAEANGATVTSIDCDLLDFDSVRSAAEAVRKACPAGLDVLCCNAGIMAMPDKAGKDGYDVQMTTNHLSHFLLTKELMPLLEKKANASPDGEARVVHMTSEARRFPPTPFNPRYLGKNSGDLGGDCSKLQLLTMNGPNWERYHQTKLANALFNYALHDKLKARGSRVKAMLAHPGGSLTELQLTTAEHNGLSRVWTERIFGLFAMSAEDGAVGMILCMCELGLPSGTFYGPRWNLIGDAVKLTPERQLVSEVATEHKKLLWDESCKAVGGFVL